MDIQPLPPLRRHEAQKMIEDVGEILDCLKGNGLGAQKGMIERVDDLERAEEATAIEIRGLRRDLREWRLKIKWATIGYGAGSGGIVVGAIAIIKAMVTT